MQDNKPEQAQDAIVEEEDFDLEDFDDDFEDDSWDDFDEDNSSEGSDENDQDRPSTGAPASGKKKTFLQKYFNIIVIGIVVLGAGGWFLMQPAGQPVTDTTQAQNQLGFDQQETAPIGDIAELSSDTGLPPQPAPINTMADNIGMDITEESAPEPRTSIEGIEPEILTPMPEAEDSTTLELADLGLSLDEAPAEESPEESATLEITESPGLQLDQIETPEAQEELELTETPDFLEETPQDVNIEDTGNIIQDLELETLETEPTSDIASLEPIMEPVPATVPDTAAIDAVTGRIETLEGKLETINSELSGNLTATNSKIDALAESIQALEKQVSKLASAPPPAVATPIEKPVTAPVAKTPVKPAPKKPAPKTSKPPVSEAEPAPVPVAKQAANWVLRSAQPGKAMVTNKDTGDIRTIEVGDTLKGIGQISSISIENGKWVVRGPQGIISQ